MTEQTFPKIGTGLLQRRRLLMAALVIQLLCLAFLGTEATMDMFGLELEDMLGTQDMLEFFIVLALALGAGVMAYEVRALLHRQKAMEDQLMAASGAFHELLEKHFEDWGLTPSECDVALMAIKGLSIAEIAEVRNTAQGTVKAQCNKIYSKAGVTGRPQLLSLFIEELMAESLIAAGGKNVGSMH